MDFEDIVLYWYIVVCFDEGLFVVILFEVLIEEYLEWVQWLCVQVMLVVMNLIGDICSGFYLCDNFVVLILFGFLDDVVVFIVCLVIGFVIVCGEW